MERKTLTVDSEKWKRIESYANSNGNLTQRLAWYAAKRYSAYSRKDPEQVLGEWYGKPVRQLTLEEFLSKDLKKAVTVLGGESLGERIFDLIRLRIQGQFSETPWRRSYRSGHFSFYVWNAIDMIGGLLKMSCSGKTVEQQLYYEQPYDSYYKYELALEIQRGNERIISLLREAVLGDNTQVLLSRDIIEGIIISGDESLVEDLIRLLLAAKLQEGLRQQILESADRGSIRVLARFLQVCIEENLFRYSSAIRALNTWAGLGFVDTKASTAREYARLAYECLTDVEKIQTYIQSGNNLEAYFALWAMGCRELMDTLQLLPELLEDGRHYRRVLGWLFVTNTEDPVYRMALASRYLEERDEELLAWIVNNLARASSMTIRFVNGHKQLERAEGAVNPALPTDARERRALFARLRQVAEFIGNRKKTFAGNPFDFISVTLESERVYECMIALAAEDMDAGLIAQLLELAEYMTTEQRETLIRGFINPSRIPAHRAFLRRCLNDRSIYVKETAVQRLSALALEREDLELLREALRSKSSSFRAGILTVLKTQSVRQLEPLLEPMLRSGEENQQQAAIELLTQLKDKYPEVMERSRAALDALQEKAVSTQTQILLDKLLASEKKQEVYSRENGYGVYDPAVIEAYAAGLAAPARKTGLMFRLFGNKQDGLMSIPQLKAWLPDWPELDRVLQRMNKVFTDHADYAYECRDFDGRRERLFGDPARKLYLAAEYNCIGLFDKKARLDMIPFWPEFREALGEYATDATKMLALYYVLNTNTEYAYSSKGIPEAWFVPVAAAGLAPRMYDRCREAYPRMAQMGDIIDHLYKAFDPGVVFAAALKLYLSMVAVIGEGNLGKPCLNLDNVYFWTRGEKLLAMNHRMLLSWRFLIENLELNREDHGVWFEQECRLELLTQGEVQHGLSERNYLQAFQDEMIPQDVLTAFVMDDKPGMEYRIRELTNPRILEKYPAAVPVVKRAVDRIVEIEQTRGELPTVMTKKCLYISRLEGVRHFCGLLAALGKENFFRGYSYSQNTTKQAVLSSLLKRCYPAKDDTPQAMKQMLKQTDISDKRLAEAVMYAPQWAGFAEEILDWPGLKSGVWFFHAHINEEFSAEKETETAIFSPISPQQFNDGAFDKHWFMEAYDQLGEKRFQILYKSAKYITSGSNQHRRSQLYTDAVLGKLNARELLQEITEKRNQEKLRCYPLIPIADGDTQEALRRYEFIQKFLKESKQFGAQRRESEKKACAAAMDNLAITTGVMDVNRLMWQMESRKFEQIRPLMEPVEVEGVSFRLAIDENGDPGITVEKGGKVLKTVPKALAKQAQFLEYKETVKELKELKRRSRESMERAMMECTEFGAEELRNILDNPILAPMVNALVWTDGSHNGFLSSSGETLCLEGLDGEKIPAQILRISHPHDMKTAGQWPKFMRYLYEKKLVQPFRQVFREYYPITQEELQSRTASRRYEGHQVQPKRTVALLKSRGWTVDYEEGLQKVFYKEDLVVRMFAMADWFSPADIEAPTLETVEFFHRRTGAPVPLEQVPPILFSETMRDLDLVVSVAHVGGVDPEASHSTVEMRTAIARELTELLKLSNVSWIGAHAKIHGQLAAYSVHLGSGVVHAEGIGMIAIVPVHSQARGRIFLPFADDDPKTAEIMSKILLLSEDHKLKDPSILRQLAQ